MLSKRKFEVLIVCLGVWFGGRLVARSVDEILKIRFRCNTKQCNIYTVKWLEIRHVAQFPVTSKDVGFSFDFDQKQKGKEQGKLVLSIEGENASVIASSTKPQIYGKLNRVTNPLNKFFSEGKNLAKFNRDISFQPRWWSILGVFVSIGGILAALIIWMQEAEKVLDTSRPLSKAILDKFRRKKMPRK